MQDVYTQISLGWGMENITMFVVSVDLIWFKKKKKKKPLRWQVARLSPNPISQQLLSKLTAEAAADELRNYIIRAGTIETFPHQ